MSSYQHSNTFALLKNTKERIQGNLTTSQYLNTLDLFIDNALFPILVGSRFLDVYIAKVVAWQNLNSRRKVTTGNKKDLAGVLLNFLLVTDPSRKFEIFKSFKFDRTVKLEAIRRFLEPLEGFESLVNDSSVDMDPVLFHSKKIIFESAIAANPEVPLYGTFMQVKHWYKMACQFKEMILEKFTRRIINIAKSDYEKINYVVDLDEMIQVYMMNASKAIDKCEANSGVLATYIQTWLMSARNNVVNTLAKQKQWEESYEQLSSNGEESENDMFVEPDDSTEVVDNVRYLARLADPNGYARLVLGIEERLTISDRKILETFSKT